MYQKIPARDSTLTIRARARQTLDAMTRTLIATFVLCIAAFAQQPQKNACAATQQKQFDFWVGEWELTWPAEKAGKTAQGRNSIVRTLDGCVVQENFSGGEAMHLRGISVSTFDTKTGKWRQTWVDNEGGYLDFVGEFQDGQMILQREALRPDGTKILQRMIWKNITRNEFDWSWEASLDGGKSWQVNWPIHYKRKN